MSVIRKAAGAASFSDQKMKKTNLFETERMFCDVYGLLPGQEQSGHVHAGSDKVYYVIAGTGRFQVGDTVETAGPGDAILAPAGHSHAVSNPGPDKLSVLVFMAPKP